LKLESKYKTKIFDYYTIITAFQKIDEDRISRKLYSSERTTQEEDVNVYSINADFLKQISSKEVLYYGLELTHNSVKSSAEKEDIFSHIKTPTYTRYPSNGSEVSSSAFYATLDKSITKNLAINIGGRYSHFFNRSAFLDTLNFDLPFSSINFNAGAFSGSFSIKYEEKHGFHGELIGSSGFRSPNVDDYGKIFEKGGVLVVPNVNLRPEHVKSGELNFSKKWEKDEKEYLMFKIAGFYTAISDAIVRDDFLLNGNDSIVFDDDKVKIQANQNVSSARIYGGSFDVRINFTTYLSFNGSINYTNGKNVTDDSPLGHIPPVFGRMSLTYVSDKLMIQARSLFNGKKNITDFSSGTTDNPDEATIDGSPAWNTYSITGSYKIWKQLKVQVSVENIFDVHYKQFASGISGMGRNFVFSLSGNF
jgi:hemoglobin/transferrin/lactoferrin receptor protein